MAQESNQFVERRFACGTRLAPDSSDLFLEKLGFYRKHTPSDASCLFRAVAEQAHGVQLYHEQVRKVCVTYMAQNHALFAQNIKWNFQSHLENMTLTRTYGSLLELKALAMYYNANVVIFDPFKNGRWFMQSKTAKSTWRVFHGRNNHFDSVFTLEYMKEAAFCQALMYEIVYKNVFRMPDVEYAVERMLYDPDDNITTYEQNDHGQIVATTADGRQLVMSGPKDTYCVLTNYRLCHFHHGANFSQVQRFFSEHGNDAGYRVYGGMAGSNFCHGSRKPNPLLYDRNISCVRQLLDKGITPFAYKAAKSLDVNIYRNVEFDCWIDSMKSDALFKVGKKCLCQIDASLRVCHIEIIQPDRQTCLVRMNDAPGLICVRKEALRPYHRRNVGTRNLERAQTHNIEESVRQLSLAHQPAMEGMQLAASISEAPLHLDVNAPMFMQMTVSVSTQDEMVDWQTPVELMGPPSFIQLYHTTLWEAAQPNIDEQSIVYGRLAEGASPIPTEEQHHHQQMLNYQHQMRLQLQQHHQWQFQPPQIPISIISYNHHSNGPPQNGWYEIVVPVNTTQHQHSNQQMGYESVAGCYPPRRMQGAIHYLPNVADPSLSTSTETTVATIIPANLD